ncbi:phosphotransferase family protein [Hyphomonas sp.]|uniref:phosphotransferase family protein n=1 Tax=Hyphomonas sp. TaxID=87 RepID=UPI003F6EC890
MVMRDIQGRDMARNPDELLRKLRGHLANGERLSVVRPMSDGHSNETYFLDGLDAVLRLPPSGTPLLDGHDMATQFQIYAVVGGVEAAPPVPPVLYYCSDIDILGDPFFIMKRAAGIMYPDYGTPLWLTAPPARFRHEMTRNYVDAVVQINKMEPLEVLGPAKSQIAELERWERFAQEAGNASLLKAFTLLKETEPAPSGPAGVVHGDCKPGNTLWVGNRLSSFLDWEMAYNGDPLADLGYLLFFFESDVHPARPELELTGIWKRDQIVEAWQEGTGRSAENVEWYEAAASAKLVSILSYGHHLVQTGKSNDQRMGLWKPIIDATTEMTWDIIKSARIQ